MTIGSYRRQLALSAALSRHTIHGARVEDGTLQVWFREYRSVNWEGDR